ncbi:unnamed protein product [Leuciscus chuanchicus]
MAGEDVILKCNIVELYSPCSTVAWLRVIPENATISLTDRLQIDPHHLSNQWTSICTAVITNSTVHDSSMYYCAAVQSRFAHIGNGSRVIVKAKEHTVFPVIDILTPLIPNGPLVPLHCVVTGVESSQIHMSWAVDRRKEKGQAILTHGNDGGIQITRNQILITAEEWDRKVKCVCVVKFRGQLYTKTLQRHVRKGPKSECWLQRFIEDQIKDNNRLSASHRPSMNRTMKLKRTRLQPGRVNGTGSDCQEVHTGDDEH